MEIIEAAIVMFLIFTSLVAGREKAQIQRDGKRLIKRYHNQDPDWISEAEIFDLIEKKVHFMDITEHYFLTHKKLLARDIPISIRYQQIVNEALTNISISRMEEFVNNFDNFHDRYYTTADGVLAVDWLYSEVEESILSSGYQGSANIKKFAHPLWPQNSIIATIAGSDPFLRDRRIILGAHLDTGNSRIPGETAVPGSDDNASGCVTLLEALRVLLVSGFVPKRSIEFHWFAAEEVGLRGSAEIAKAYFEQEIKVVGMINFDVVGYHAGQNVIGLLTDRTSEELNNFLKLVISEYCTYSWVNDSCGYACSDHASFHRYNFPAAAPSEHPLNPFLHTRSDTVDVMNFKQVEEFVKLAVATAIEMAEPTKV